MWSRQIEGTRFSRLRWIPETGSTNDDLIAAAKAGEPEQVLVTDLQTAGRGRRDRTWVAPVDSSLLMSFLLRGVDSRQAFWTIGAVALSAADGLNAKTPRDRCVLKWPNDLLMGDKKVAGILAQAIDDALVVGIGINVNWPAERPAGIPDTATAYNQHLGRPITIDRKNLLSLILFEIEKYLNMSPSDLRRAWIDQCATIGRRVRVEIGGGADLVGTAVDVEPSGALVVDDGTKRHSVHVGDVVHLRLT